MYASSFEFSTFSLVQNNFYKAFFEFIYPISSPSLLPDWQRAVWQDHGSNSQWAEGRCQAGVWRSLRGRQEPLHSTYHLLWGQRPHAHCHRRGNNIQFHIFTHTHTQLTQRGRVATGPLVVNKAWHPVEPNLNYSLNVAASCCWYFCEQIRHLVELELISLQSTRLIVLTYVFHSLILLIYVSVIHFKVT